MRGSLHVRARACGGRRDLDGVVQWDTLRHLHRQRDASLHDLALLTFQADQSFGSLAVRMADHGLVERVPGSGRAGGAAPAHRRGHLAGQQPVVQTGRAAHTVDL